MGEGEWRLFLALSSQAGCRGAGVGQGWLSEATVTAAFKHGIIRAGARCESPLPRGSLLSSRPGARTINTQA